MFALITSPRILVLGLGDVARGDEGIGVRLARSLRTVLRDVEVAETKQDLDYLELFEGYDALVLLDAIGYSPEVGRILLVSPFSIREMRIPHDVDMDRLTDALDAARAYGHRIPRIEIVGICVSEKAGDTEEMSPELASKYPLVLSRVKGVVIDLIRDARKRVGWAVSPL